MTTQPIQGAIGDPHWSGATAEDDPAEVAAALGHALRDSPQHRALVLASEVLQQDAEAARAIEAFRHRQVELRMRLMLGTLTDDERRSLETLEATVNELSSVGRYRAALAAFQGIARETAGVVSSAIGIDFAANCRAGGCCG